MPENQRSFVLNTERFNFMFLRRLGQNRARSCEGGHYCSQILEMVDGDFAVVGHDITREAISALPPGPGVGPTERVVRVPRQVMIVARPEIPAA